LIKRLLTGGIVSLAVGSVAAQLVGPAATVNDENISRDKVQAQVDLLIEQRGMNYGGITHPSFFKELQSEIVEQLITQELLWQEAQRRQFVVQDESIDLRLEQIKGDFDTERAFLFKIEAGGFTEETYRADIQQQLSVERMVSEDIAPGIIISDKDIGDFYAANIDKMKIPVEVRARHILLKPDSSDAEVLKATRESLEKILSEVREGADFAALAMEYSQAPSAPAGGDLGFFGRGQMVGPFEDAAFELPPGEISDVVQTQFGYHIIKVEERRGGETVPIEEADAQIRSYLTQQTLQSEMEILVEDLREEADVEIFLAL
jgi:peptidyl-prolyl cis-trans isomerase C